MLIQPGNGLPVVLSQILGTEDVIGMKETVIRSCGTDPLERFCNGLFVCLATETESAEESIEQALLSGATAVVVRRGMSELFKRFSKHDFLYEVEDPLKVYGRACQMLMGEPAKKMKLIAVTGTAGKTALSYMIAGMLAESGNLVGLVGSLGIFDGKSLTPNIDTTPSSDKLAALLARMVKNRCSHAIIEVSSAALESGALEGLEFDAICLTNIKRAHLDLHGSLEQYRRLKMRIFDYAKSDTIVVCNLDDRVTEAILPLIKSPTMTVGIHPTESMVSGMPIEQDKSSQTFYVIAGIDAVPVRTRIIGTEHIYNCLLATALGISWGYDLHSIISGLERVEHIPCRLERIDCGQPFAVFVDNANTPEALSLSLKTLRSVTTGRLFCVLGVPGDHERSKRPCLGKILESEADVAILSLGNQKNSYNEEILNDIISGVETRDSIRTFTRRKDAVSWALSEAEPEDTILFISASYPVELKTRKEQAADRQFVRHWLYENQPCMEPFWF